MNINKVGINYASFTGVQLTSSQKQSQSKEEQSAKKQTEVCSKDASSALRSMALAGMGISKPIASKPVDFMTAEQRQKAEHYKNVLNKAFEFDKNSEHPLVLEKKNDFVDRLAKKMATKPDKPVMIAITGESASGKSTFAKSVAEYAKENGIGISFMTTDNYFKDLSPLIEKYGSYGGILESGYDVDSPNNFYLEDLKQNLADLADGKDTMGRKYMMDGTCRSFANAVPIKSDQIVFVEGTAAMLDGIGEYFDAKIYVDLDEEVRKSRMLKRAPERGQSPEEALLQWEKVKIAGQKYVQPFREKCDMVITSKHEYNDTKQQVKDDLAQLKALKDVPTPNPELNKAA